MIPYRINLLGMALATFMAPAEMERANRPGPVEPKRASGNPSGHTPHQGKREMERRRKRMEKESGK
jgi:hypothetical protein